MNEIENALRKVQENLFKEPIVEEYFRFKNLIKNDQELLSLFNKRKEAQLLMCKNKENDEIYFAQKNKYECYDKQIKTYPLYCNFLQVEEEVKELLLQIKKVLE